MSFTDENLFINHKKLIDELGEGRMKVLLLNFFVITISFSAWSQSISVTVDGVEYSCGNSEENAYVYYCECSHNNGSSSYESLSFLHYRRLNKITGEDEILRTLKRHTDIGTPDSELQKCQVILESHPLCN